MEAGPIQGGDHSHEREEEENAATELETAAADHIGCFHDDDGELFGMNGSGNIYSDNYSSREDRHGHGSWSSVNGGTGDVDGGQGRQPMAATSTIAIAVKGATSRRDGNGIGEVPPSDDNTSKKTELVEEVVVGSKQPEPAVPRGGRDGIGSDTSEEADGLETTEIGVTAVRDTAQLVVTTGAASETVASSSNNGGHEPNVSAARCSDKLSSAKEGVYHRRRPLGGLPSREDKAALLLNVVDENTTTRVSVDYGWRGIKRSVFERGGETTTTTSSSSISCSEEGDYEEIVDGAAGRGSPPMLERKIRAMGVNDEDDTQQHQTGVDPTADTRSSHESGRLDIVVEGEMKEPQERYPPSRRGTGDAEDRLSLSFVRDEDGRESGSSDEIDRSVTARHLGDLQQHRKSIRQQGADK